MSERFYKAIAQHGKAIGKAASQGDAGARRIMQLYEMHYACPGDPGALGLCEAVLNEWIAASAVPNTPAPTPRPAHEEG